jgi:acetyl-CoA carboxylase carboxyltransferase component
MVCGFARLEGRAVGIVANQPRYIGGVLDAESATKAARFVRTCNAFGIPLVVFVDTPGFLPGTKQERGGVIRHGAKLVHAFAEASVPKVTVVLRKAFGGALIAMNSRDLGADYVFAWPQAQLGVMGAKQAVGIVARRDIAAADDPVAHRDALAAAYADEHLSATGAAAEGHVDEVICPADTRRRLCEALSTLTGIARPTPGVRNIPL